MDQETERNCSWMSGPRDATSVITPAKWWLAISRDLFAKDLARGRRSRPPVTCTRTPTFISPLHR
jgi:hypothetical protein